MNSVDFKKVAFVIGNLLLLVGAVAFWIKYRYSAVFFTIGAVVLIFLQMEYVITIWKKGSRYRRLAINALFSTLMLGVGAYFIIVGSNSWVVALLIYALTSFYLSFRSPKEN